MNEPLNPNNLPADASMGTSLEPTSLGLDWIDDTVTMMSRICNLCGTYEIRQVGFEWLQEEVQQQPKAMKWKSCDLEIELYRKFLFDESSVGGRDD